MTYEVKDMSGSMFVNDRKESNKHPDRQGSCKINGEEFRISGWIEEGKGGKKPWLSLKFKPKDAARTTDKARQAPIDDAIEF